MRASGLDLQPDGLDRVAEFVRAAGEVLATGLGVDVEACGGDEVSKAIMDNLNARRRWLIGHVKAGHGQALAAADTVAGNVVAYRTEDADAAARYGGAGGAGLGGGAPGAAAAGPMAPAGPPAVGAIPDISGRDGEELALALESGAGPGPATAAAARLSDLAAQAAHASTQLLAAQGQLAASGQSQVHAPLTARHGRRGAAGSLLLSGCRTRTGPLAPRGGGCTSTTCRAWAACGAWTGRRLPCWRVR